MAVEGADGDRNPRGRGGGLSPMAAALGWKQGKSWSQHEGHQFSADPR